MRKILLSALLIVTTYALAIFLKQINILGKVENMDIDKAIQNFITNQSYVVEALKNNKISEDEKTILPRSEEKLKDGIIPREKIVKRPQVEIFDENTCKEIVFEYLKKSLYVSDINSYQSVGRGKIATKDYFSFHFYNNNMYLISYYVDNNFNIFYRDIFSDELRQAGTENLYRNITLNFNNSVKINEEIIIDLVNKNLNNGNGKYEIIYGGNYNINNREMLYLYYYNDDDNIMEIYYDCNNQQLYAMTEILQPILEY